MTKQSSMTSAGANAAGDGGPRTAWHVQDENKKNII